MWCSSIFRSHFIAAVAFDLIAQWTKRGGLADAAYYNLLGAAITTLPVLATGIVAWQYQLERAETEGHPIAARGTCVRLDRDDLAGLVGKFPRTAASRSHARYRLAIEFLAVAAVMLTGHLGGFRSGVNGLG